MAKAAVITRCEDRDVFDSIERMRSKYHSELNEFEVTIGVLQVDRRKGDDGEWIDGPLLSLHGYEAVATIRITSHLERLMDVPDAILTVNGERWRDLTDEQRDALIDHELEHLEIVRDGENTPLYDDNNRVRLRCRKHDWQMGGFHSVVRRHGTHAIEAEAVARVRHSPLMQQLRFDFESLTISDITVTNADGTRTSHSDIREAAEHIVPSAKEQFATQRRSRRKAAKAKT